MGKKRAKGRVSPVVNLPSEQDKNLMRMRAVRSVAEEMGVSSSIVPSPQPATYLCFCLFGVCLPQTSFPCEV